MKEVIGVFKAVKGGKRRHLIYVSQEVKTNRKKVVTGASKTFTLDAVDGEEVMSTSDPEVFLLKDGTKVRKSGNILSEESIFQLPKREF